MKDFSPEVTKELLKLRQAQVYLRHQRERYLRSNRIQFFKPNSPKQISFFANAHKPVRAIFAGNRFGKSTCGVAEDVSWLLGFRPWIPEGDPLRTLGIPEHGVKGIVICENWDKVREIFTNCEHRDERMGKLFWFLPEWAIKKTSKNAMGVIDTVYTEVEINGKLRESTLVFETVSSFKNNKLGLESSDWDFAHFDEPVPKDLYNAIMRGTIDRGGKCWFLMTPLREPWIYNMFSDPPEGSNPDDYWFETANMDENPTLDQDSKNRFLAGLTEEERNCREKGIPLAFGNLVYSHFDKAYHVWGEDRGTPAGWVSRYKPSRDYLITVSIDPHPQTPHAVLFTAVGPEHVFFYDEIFKKCRISELVEMIEERIQGLRVNEIICDPFAWITNPETGRCWADVFFEMGLPITRATKDKSHGIIETQQIFHKNFDKRIFVMPHMRVFLKEITNYFFDKENNAVDKDDHLMECMYRTVMHDGLRWYNESSNRECSVSFSDEQYDLTLI